MGSSWATFLVLVFLVLGVTVCQGEVGYRTVTKKIMECLNETFNYAQWIEGKFDYESEFATETVNNNGKIIAALCRYAYDHAKSNA
jgi:hypothetical protein